LAATSEPKRSASIWIGLAPEQDVDPGVDRRPQALQDVLHGPGLADHQGRVQGQVLDAPVAGQDRLVAPDVVHQPQGEEVAQGVQGRLRRPLGRVEAAQGAGHEVGALQGAEDPQEDPRRLVAELPLEERRAAGPALALGVGTHLLQHLVAGRHPPRLGGGDELHPHLARVGALAQEEEEGAAAEVGQQALGERFQGGAALGVGQHPVAVPRQVLDHEGRGHDDLPGGGRGLVLLRALALRLRRHVLHQQGDPPQLHLVQHLELRLLDPPAIDHQALPAAQVLHPQDPVVHADPGMPLGHAAVRQEDVAAGPAADHQLLPGHREAAHAVRCVGDQAEHRLRLPLRPESRVPAASYDGEGLRHGDRSIGLSHPSTLR
jgi:hypothetical protein